MSRYELLLGDCLEKMQDIPDGSVDLVVTDIPYGEVNRKSNGLRNLDKEKADVVTFLIPDLMTELIRVTTGSIYIFCGTEQVSEIRRTMVLSKMSTRLVIWEKTNPSPMNGRHIWLSGVECCVYGKKRGGTFNEHCKNTVLRYPCGRNKLHPTQKPTDLIQKLVEVSSNRGDTVLDPFMGSGTTGVACANTGRRFIGMEIEEQYFQIAKERVVSAYAQPRA